MFLKRCNLFLLAGMAFMLLQSCGKSKDPVNESNKYYIRFKFGDKLIEFTDTERRFQAEYIAVANSVYSAPNYLHVISGAKNTADLIAKKNFFSLSLLTTKDLANNISFASNSSLSENYLNSIAFALGYTDENGKQFLAYGEDFAPYVLQQKDISISTNNKITFSEITSDHVKGNFYGTVYADDFETERQVTEGTFFLKLIK